MGKIEELIKEYKKNLGFTDFYKEVIQKIKDDSNKYIQNEYFLYKYEQIDNTNLEINNDTKDEEKFKFQIQEYVKYNRIDVPIWFGDFENSENRIIIYGIQPSKSKDEMIIEKKEKKRYATPFGCELWNKPEQNKYYKAFHSLIDKFFIEKNNVFILFSDLVKNYEIVNEENEDFKNFFEELKEKEKRTFKEALNSYNKLKNSENKFYYKKLEKNSSLLNKEIKIIKPNYIILLGKQVKEYFNLIKDEKLNGFYKEVNIKEITHHPSYVYRYKKDKNIETFNNEITSIYNEIENSYIFSNQDKISEILKEKVKNEKIKSITTLIKYKNEEKHDERYIYLPENSI
jgi:hypothetical protein